MEHLNPKIRRLKEDEWPLYRELRLNALMLAPEAFGTKYDDAVKLPELEWQARAKRFAELDETACMVAEASGKFVGLIACFIRQKPEMVQMWVDPQFRRKKVAEGLIRALLEWVKDKKRDAIYAWVAEDNVPALRLYEKLGFTNTGNIEAIHLNSRRKHIELVCKISSF